MPGVPDLARRQQAEVKMGQKIPGRAEYYGCNEYSRPVGKIIPGPKWQVRAVGLFLAPFIVPLILLFGLGALFCFWMDERKMRKRQ